MSELEWMDGKLVPKSVEAVPTSVELGTGSKPPMRVCVAALSHAFARAPLPTSQCISVTSCQVCGYLPKFVNTLLKFVNTLPKFVNTLPQFVNTLPQFATTSALSSK
eukprot:2695227-Pleurochrysis_carterae.AAC.1